MLESEFIRGVGRVVCIVDLRVLPFISGLSTYGKHSEVYGGAINAFPVQVLLSQYMNAHTRTTTKVNIHTYLHFTPGIHARIKN